MKVLVFGQLKEIIGSDSLAISGIESTDLLIEHFRKKYPAIAEINYLIAVDKEVIQENTLLNDENTIALLPPYAGG